MCQFVQYMGGDGTGSAQRLLRQALSAGLRSQGSEPPWVKCPEPFPKAQAQKGCWKSPVLQGRRTGTCPVLPQHWTPAAWGGKCFKHTHRFTSNQTKAGLSKSSNSDFSPVRNSAPYWFYSFLPHDKNVSPVYFTNSCRRCLLPDQLTLQCFQRAPKKEKENLQEDGPSAQ